MVRRAFGLGSIVLATVLLTSAPAAQAQRHPSYHSPGYAGTKKLPKVRAVRPPPLVHMPGTGGSDPGVLVDDAGTAHVGWATQAAGQSSVLHYCRLQRGAKTCAAVRSLTIPSPPGLGNGDVTNIDEVGPKPLRVGNELLLLDDRCCNEAPAPDGTTHDNPDYLFTSEDGGDTFTGPDAPGSFAGLVGTVEPSGNAIVYGGNDPSIGVVTDTKHKGHRKKRKR
jgi:hypothetical protein